MSCLVTPVPDGCSTRRNVVAEEPSCKTLLQNNSQNNISAKSLHRILTQSNKSAVGIPVQVSPSDSLDFR